MTFKSTFLLFGTLLASTNALAENTTTGTCFNIPSCNDLGYITPKDECNWEEFLVCPFDNKWVFCPRDCSKFPLARGECLDERGECEQCAKDGMWRYKSCKEEDGWDFVDGYNCVPSAGCPADKYPYTEKPEESKGIINSCMRGGIRYYGYAENGCYEDLGWVWEAGKCLPKECENSFIFPEENCPDYADCSDVCVSATKEYRKIVCEQGLQYQKAINRCVKRLIGSIAYYCPETDKFVTERQDNDASCTPIGIVIDSTPAITKVMALTDIDRDGMATETTSKTCWSSKNFTTEYLIQYDTEAQAALDMNGKANTTQTILTLQQEYDDLSNVARGTRQYAPETCPPDSVCGIGNWYLPAPGEMLLVYRYWFQYKETGAYQNIANIEGAVQPAAVDDGYWTSCVKRDLYPYLVNVRRGAVGDTGTYNCGRPVRPFLEIKE